MNSVASSHIYDNDQSSIVTAYHSIRDYVKERYPSLTTRKFLAAIVWSIVAVGIFNLIFLPRTSLGRDYRRLHFSALTKDETERLFLKALNEENNAGEQLRQYMKHQHLSGDGDEYVQYTMEQLRQYGLKPYKEVYYTWMTKHVESTVSVFDEQGSLVYSPSLLEVDPVSGVSSQGYHAYSGSGDVTAPYIFVNYGSLDDYRQLRNLGVDLKGKIHIIRTGKVSTALQVEHAESNGAVGVITYMDPSDDGKFTMKNGFEQYPDGPARNTSSVKRDTVLRYSQAPGDPTTIGFPSNRAVKRRKPHNLPKIPSIPMSADKITPILQRIPSSHDLNWTGDIEGFDYSCGPSNFTINLVNHNEAEVVPLKNIMYEIPGLLSEKVILGNHRDSLTMAGAADPGSGTAILLEISRAFGSLIKLGWRPLRTIVVASWDGSAHGMLGSTEYAESHEVDLQAHAIAYINLDAGVTGHNLDIVSNPLLDHFLIGASKNIPFNNYSDTKSLFDYWEESHLGSEKINRLGSGSDFTVFQHHLGIPSCNVGFHGDPNDSLPVNIGSSFDTLDWMERFVDPNYEYHGTMAKYLGFLALSLSEHEVIEYKVEHYAHEIKGYFNDLISIIPSSWWDRDVERGTSMSLAIDQVKYLIEQLLTVSTNFDRTAQLLQEQISVDYPWFQFYIKLRLAMNSKIIGNKAKDIDQMFLTNKGIKGRPWMKHLVFAPDRDTGDDVSLLPSLRESLADGEFDAFIASLQDIASALRRATKRLRL